MTILERLLRHDAWTTRTLLSLAADLPDAALDREFDIGHRTLRRTFVHMIANMEIWCDLMTAQPQRTAATSQNTIPSLIARLDLVAGQLLALGQSVAAEQREEEYFVDSLDTPPRRKPLGAGLVHIATHGMHHRAQCLFLMRQLGIKNLVEGDALSWELQHRGMEQWPTITAVEGMAHEFNINVYLQSELRRRALKSVTAVEAAQWLDNAAVLRDSRQRPGLPLRNLLRAKMIVGARQEMNHRWFIDQVDS